MPAMANVFVRSAPGLVLWPWPCFYPADQRGDGGYSPLMAKNLDVLGEAQSEDFLGHQSVDFGRLSAFRG